MNGQAGLLIITDNYRLPFSEHSYSVLRKTTSHVESKFASL
jgi:hypothetical protein